MQLLALTGCGLSGGIPAWVGRLPNVTAVELSGNDLTGPIPVFRAGSRLEQFSAANNRLTGTLDPLRNCTRLALLDVASNDIGGTVGPWLANRSRHMALLATADNRLSCALPAATRINATAPGSALDVLRGNRFGCPVPPGVVRADHDAASYRCGSEEYTVAGALCGVVVAVAAGVVGAGYLVVPPSTK